MSRVDTGATVGVCVLDIEELLHMSQLEPINVGVITRMQISSAICNGKLRDRCSVTVKIAAQVAARLGGVQ